MRDKSTHIIRQPRREANQITPITHLSLVSRMKNFQPARNVFEGLREGGFAGRIRKEKLN